METLNENTMTSKGSCAASLDRLQYLIETIPSKLIRISQQEFNQKLTPDKWSKKEILGHLIDSAANNHQRFIRSQYENTPTIFYDQNKWNEINNWQDLDSKNLINFWIIFNHHLINVIRNIPKEKLTLKCNTGDDKIITLEFLITDYVDHLEHHLNQII